MARRQGRPRRGTEPLTRERILQAALELLDGHGLEGFSMRRLAAELGVDPMALYHHLPGKEAILEGVAGLVFSKLRVERCDDWREQVRAFARSYGELVRAHPHLALLLIQHVEAGGEPVLQASEQLYAALERSGLPGDRIAQAADVIIDYVHGFALSEGLALQGGAPGTLGLAGLLARHPHLNLPALRRALEVSSDRVGAAQGDLGRGVDIILAGIEALCRK